MNLPLLARSCCQWPPHLCRMRCNKEKINIETSVQILMADILSYVTVIKMQLQQSLLGKQQL